MTDPSALLLRCAQRNEACALITVRRIDGRSPRHVGAQMAITQTETAGSMSSGCIDHELIARARFILGQDRSEQISVGGANDALDLRLPCGSAMQLQLDGQLKPSELRNLFELQSKRLPCFFSWQGSGTASVSAHASPGAIVKHPVLRLLLAGQGDAFRALATLAKAAGLAVEAYSPQVDDQLALQSKHVDCGHLDASLAVTLDSYSAAITLFHQHELELAFLRPAIAQKQCLLIAAMGSRGAHLQRTHALREQGCSDLDIAKIESPFGLIPRARDPQLLAVSMLAACMQRYRNRFSSTDA